MELVWSKIASIGVPDNANCITVRISAPSVLVYSFECSEESTDLQIKIMKILILVIFKIFLANEAEKKFIKRATTRLISFTNFNAQFLDSLTIYTLHYNPRHVSCINMPIFRKTNCIITASGIVTLCKRLYNMPDESRLCRVCSHPAYCIAVYRQ